MRLKIFICFVLLPHLLWSQQIIEKEITGWEFRMAGDSVWKPAKVPGTIIDNFVDLSDVSKPLHPYYGDNEKLYQWIGENEWEFRTKIDIEEDLANQVYTYDISFGCLDLFADIFINGIKYTSNNAFIPFEIKELRGSSFDIRIVFHSTDNIVKEILQKDSLLLPGGERVYARTAQYQFGWDWGPKFVNMGIRKPVKLKAHIKQQINFSASASLLKFDEKFAEFFVDFDITGGYDDFMLTYIIRSGGKIIEKSIVPVLKNNQKEFTTRSFLIKDPKLWWPNQMGKEVGNYYEIDFELRLQTDTCILAKHHIFLPICRIDLVKEKDGTGESFYFKVNGEKVYAKGANYVPDDSFDPGKNTGELIKMAKNANMNMLRVWGGGTYPDDDFYVECMKNGLMVWQDFMFACAMYPGDEFLNNAAMEASTQVERLKEFNNIAVWCGNNENEEGWKNWGWQKDLNIHGEDSMKIWNNYDILFNKILPETIGTANQLYGSHLNYISTSPQHGWGRKESMTNGDSHYWGVWWGLEPIEKYNEKVPRFMSEFGMQGMPDLSTLTQIIPDSAMNFGSPKFKNHQKHPTGFKTLDHYLKEYLVIPNDMSDYAYATQILQAYALTTAIEAQRRAMPYCMGSLIWQLNDCWPVTSWSLIDYNLNKKIGYDLVKKTYAPVIISIKEEKNTYDIYIVNDSLVSFEDNLTMYVSDFYGKVLWNEKIHIKVNNQSSAVYYSLNKKQLKNVDCSSIYMHAHLGDNVYRVTNNYHFKKLNELSLPIPHFHIEKEDHSCYSITSDVYVPYVWVEGFGYRGHIGPGEKIMLYVTDENKDAINKLIADPTMIKCLNQLLKK